MRGIANKISFREETYRDSTEEIFEDMLPILEGIAEHLEQDLMDIKWKDLEFWSNDIIAIHAVAPISKTQQELGIDPTLHRTVTVGIPLEIVENGNLEDVRQFLIEAELAKNNLREDIIEASEYNGEEGITEEEWEAIQEAVNIPKDKMH